MAGPTHTLTLLDACSVRLRQAEHALRQARAEAAQLAALAGHDGISEAETARRLGVSRTSIRHWTNRRAGQHTDVQLTID